MAPLGHHTRTVGQRPIGPARENEMGDRDGEFGKHQIPSPKLQTRIKIQPPNSKPYDLEERTLEFAKRVIRLCRQIRQDAITSGLISQVVRACGSVGANYREANDALSKKDCAHRMKIARKEAKEAHFWLQLLEEAAPQVNGALQPLLGEALELRSIFSSIVKKIS